MRAVPVGQAAPRSGSGEETKGIDLLTDSCRSRKQDAGLWPRQYGQEQYVLGRVCANGRDAYPVPTRRQVTCTSGIEFVTKDYIKYVPYGKDS